MTSSLSLVRFTRSQSSSLLESLRLKRDNRSFSSILLLDGPKEIRGRRNGEQLMIRMMSRSSSVFSNYYHFNSSTTNIMQVWSRIYPGTSFNDLSCRLFSSEVSDEKKQSSKASPSVKISPPEKSYVSKARDLTKSGVQIIINFIIKTPGVLWYFLTHPSELRAKLVEFKELVKKEAHHYYMGSKLLVADIRTARTILLRTLNGSHLSRRERKQLVRTVSDVFRLVPMSVFVLVPFMEFLLPFALKLFPNMLPSTFQDSLKAEENMKRELQSRIAMAGFLQETLQSLVKKKKGGDTSSPEKSDSATDFLQFLESSRKGEPLPPDAIIKFSSYFKDEFTLGKFSLLWLRLIILKYSEPPLIAMYNREFSTCATREFMPVHEYFSLWSGLLAKISTTT